MTISILYGSDLIFREDRLEDIKIGVSSKEDKGRKKKGWEERSILEGERKEGKFRKRGKRTIRYECGGVSLQQHDAFCGHMMMEMGFLLECKLSRLLGSGWDSL